MPCLYQLMAITNSDNNNSTDRPANRNRLYYGWIIVIVVGLAGFTQSAESYPILGVFMKPMTEEFGWSRTVFSGSTLIGTLIGGLLSIIIGPRLDRFGSRWTLTTTFAILGFTLVLTAFISELWQFYVLQIIGRALTMGILALILGVVVPKWFVVKRGRAVALGGLGQRIGNAGTPLYVQFLVSQGSWRLATAVAGVLMWTVSMIPAAIFMRHKPEDMGLSPDGVNRENNIDDESGHANGIQDQEISMTRNEALMHPSFYLMMIAFSLAFLAAPAMNLHMIPYMTDKGIPEGYAVTATAVLSVFAGIGSIFSGFLSERITARKTLIGIFMFMGLGFLMLLRVETALQSMIWAVYYGLSFGGMFIGTQLIVADFYGREHIGAIRGVIWPIQLIFNASGPFIAALAYDSSGNYDTIFTVFAFFMISASIMMLFTKAPSGLKPVSKDA